MKPSKQIFALGIAIAISQFGCTTTPVEPQLGIPIDSGVFHAASRIIVSLDGVESVGIQQAQNADTTIFRGLSNLIGISNRSSVRRSSDSLFADTSYSWSSSPQPPYYREDEIRGSLSTRIHLSIGPNNTLQGVAEDGDQNWAKNHWGDVYDDHVRSASIQFHSLPCVGNHGDTVIFQATGSILSSIVDRVNSSYTQSANGLNYPRTEWLQSVHWSDSTGAVLVVKVFR